MRLDGEWRSHLRGPVKPRGAAWTVTGMLVVLGVTEGFVLPALSGSALPWPVLLVVALILAAATRVGLGLFVAWRMLRAGVEDASVVVRTVVVAMLAGFLLLWFAGWVVIRPVWGLRDVAVEIGEFTLGLVLWVAPAALGAYWFSRRSRSGSEVR